MLTQLADCTNVDFVRSPVTLRARRGAPDDWEIGLSEVGVTALLH